MNAVRRDLADLRLAQFVFAPHYAAPMACIANRRADLLPAADPGVLPVSEILPGETFELFEISRSFGWGMCDADGSVGFVDRRALDVLAQPQPTPNLPHSGDHAAIAQAMAGTPYRPGGRSASGCDPAGLVFCALAATGTRPLRFLDLQATTIGSEAPAGAAARGDILFFAQHAAIMLDAATAMFVAEDQPVAALALADILARPEIGAIVARRRPA